jgi:orotate phosphoribosyltransferase
MDRTELAHRIYSVSRLRGHFILRSGQISDQYFDKYLFESEPALLAEIVSHLSHLIPSDTQILAGLEMGGIPVATALSLRTGLPVIFVRKKAKEYGTRKFAEGIEIVGKNVCIVEDVVTTGGQILLSAGDLRRLGAFVNNVVCVIMRDSASREKLRESGLELYPLFIMSELESHIKRAPPNST